MTKQIPNDWMDVGGGIYHFEDMGIYSSDKLNEVHLLNVTKSKFSFLFCSQDWTDILNFVKERGAN